jgi:hypothetical protein
MRTSRSPLKAFGAEGFFGDTDVMGGISFGCPRYWPYNGPMRNHSLFCLYCIAGSVGFAWYAAPLMAQVPQSPPKARPPLTRPTPQPTPKPSPLIGVWQASEVMGAGWEETYRFFPNGTISHHFPQSDGISRLRAEHGSYTLKGDTLTLLIKEQTILTGGKVAPASGSTATDTELQGAIPKRVQLKQRETRTLKLGKIAKHGASGRLSVTLGKRRFYLFDRDPKNYP